MARLSDPDLQALLAGDADALDKRLDAESRVHLDAYREVAAALGEAPASFAPGFADRVAAAVEVRGAARVRRAAFPWALAAATAAVALAVFVLQTEALQAGLAEFLPWWAFTIPPFVAEAAPWALLALLLLTAAETVDRFVGRPAA